MNNFGFVIGMFVFVVVITVGARVSVERAAPGTGPASASERPIVGDHPTVAREFPAVTNDRLGGESESGPGARSGSMGLQAGSMGLREGIFDAISDSAPNASKAAAPVSAEGGSVQKNIADPDPTGTATNEAHAIDETVDDLVTSSIDPDRFATRSEAEPALSRADIVPAPARPRSEIEQNPAASDSAAGEPKTDPSTAATKDRVAAETAPRREAVPATPKPLAPRRAVRVARAQPHLPQKASWVVRSIPREPAVGVSLRGNWRHASFSIYGF